MVKNYNLEDAEKYGEIQKYRLFPSTRGTLVFLGFLGSVVLYLMRVNMSVAIICMTIDDTEQSGNVTTQQTHIRPAWHQQSYMWTYLEDNWDARQLSRGYTEDQCPGEGGGEDDNDDDTGIFDWDRDLRGTINSSFFWGYVLTQVIGGMLAIRYGCRWIIAIGVTVQVALTFFSPPASHLSPYALMAVRFIEGLGAGVYYPCFHHMWAEWAPPDERSFLTTFVLSGTSWGSLVSFALSGVLCAELGWEWVFWIYGICGIIWVVLWLVFVYDPPEVHPRIAQEELDYIKHSKLSEGKDKVKMKTPWLKILFSPCVLCIYIPMFTGAWGGYTTLTSLPQYMKDVLKLDIKTNGFYNSLPHLSKFLMTIILAVVADKLIAKKWLSNVHTRKLMESLGTLIPAVLLIAVTYLDCYSTGLVITCLTLAEGFTGGGRAGGMTNMIEIAPRYAGLIMGVGNTISNCAGIFAPIVVGKLTPDGTEEQWRHVFLLSATLYCIGWLSFVTLAKGDIQPWALPPENEAMEIDVFAITVDDKQDGVNKESEVKEI